MTREDITPAMCNYHVVSMYSYYFPVAKVVLTH